MNSLDISATESRIMELAKKISELYSTSELESLSPISPQTIIRWAEGKHRPSKSTASVIPNIIAVNECDYQDYLNKKIDLETLWSLRGTANKENGRREITLQGVLNDAKLLNTMERLKLLSSLALTLSPQEVDNTLHCPNTEDLNPQAKTRLKNLINISNAYRNQSIQQIVEHGADKALVEDILDKFENQYTKSVYNTLLPYVCVPNSWNGGVPIITDPAKKFTTVDDLIDSLNAG